jgi:hypothetical protein
MTVDADDAEGLRSAIAEQERLASPVGTVSSGPAASGDAGGR